MTDVVEVVQADREAAAEISIASPVAKEETRQGKYDNLPLVQAFARHRRAALAALEREGFAIVPREPTEAMIDEAADAYVEAVEAAKAKRKARNDDYEARGMGRFAAEDASFPIDWIEPVYRAMLSAIGKGEQP